jgi:hypothetical protein
MTLGIGLARAFEQLVALRTGRSFGGLQLQVCRVCFEAILGGRSFIGMTLIRHDAGFLTGMVRADKNKIPVLFTCPAIPAKDPSAIFKLG